MFSVPWPSDWEKGKDYEVHLERFQVFSTPWLVAYHAIYHALAGGVGATPSVGDAPPGPPAVFGVPGARDFAPDEWLRDASTFLRARYDAGASEWGAPYRVYTRSELREFAAETRSRGESRLAALSDDDLVKPFALKGGNGGELLVDRLIGDIQHMSEHAAELALFLGQVSVCR